MQFNCGPASVSNNKYNNESKPDDIRFTLKRNRFCVCFSGFAAAVLQKAQVRIINRSVCNDLMEGQITSRMLCAGVLSGGVDACQVTNGL